jgi:predicted permease
MWNGRNHARRYWVWIDQLAHDVRFSARALTRSPGFTAAVVLTLSLAIGATTSIFNVADEALFRPLPLPQAEQLTAVYNYNQKTAAYLSSSYPDYVDYRNQTQTFEQLSAYVRYPFAVSVGNRTLRVTAEAVTLEYFQMLQLQPLAGSTFTSDDAPEALLSERLWREQFGGAVSALGATVRIERQPFRIVGIIPERFRGANLNWSEPPEVWIPLRAVSIPVPRLGQMKIFGLRSARWLALLGRRKPGVTVEQAQAELRNLAASLASAEPANKDITAVAFDASRSKFWPAFRDKVALSLGMFGIAAAMVLLLACANVSNLLLERALARRREIAVRLAIGAGRARLIRQMFVEGFLLVTPGFLGAMALSRILAKLVSRYPSAIGDITLSLEPQMDGRVLLFGFLLSLLAVVLFGLAPALQATRSGPQSVLKESGNSVTRGREQWLREAMVVAQIALTTILLIGGGLFARSLLRGYSVDPGFTSDHLIVSTFDFNAVPPQTRPAFVQRLLDEAVTLPGIESVAVSPHLPLVSGGSAVEVSAPGSMPQAVSLRYAGPGFFHTMGISLRAGREFAPPDRMASLAVVSEDLARRLWPETNPLGRTLLMKRGSDAGMQLEVVGVSGGVRASSLWEEPGSQVYVPWDTASTQHWILRTRGEPAGQLPAVREFWNRIAPEVSLWDLRTGDEIIGEELAPQRLAAQLFGAFGFLAITLASVGLYSLTAFGVARRTQEIGIRIAIGAAPVALAGRILARALLVATLGLVAGLAAALRLGKLVSPLVHEVSPADALTLMTVVAALLAVTALAALAPAFRATRVDPAAILRKE